MREELLKPTNSDDVRIPLVPGQAQNRRVVATERGGPEVLELVTERIPEPERGLCSVVVYRVCASTLVVMAGISLFTGARTAIIPMKLCPAIFLVAALLFFLPTIL